MVVVLTSVLCPYLQIYFLEVRAKPSFSCRLTSIFGHVCVPATSLPSTCLLGDQTYRSSQYQRYLQMLKQGQTEAPARNTERKTAPNTERTSAPERTTAPARTVWQRTANTK